MNDSTSANVGARYGFVLVLALGRTGSTLVQGVLNSIPGYLIRGENQNVLFGLYQAYRSLARRRQQFAERADIDTPRHPWFGIRQVDLEAMEIAFRDVMVRDVLRPAADTRVLGFKEIRYTSRNVPPLRAYLGFVRRVLPDVKFVVNRREPAAVSRSKWWTRFDGNALEFITQEQDRLERVTMESGAPTHVLDYDRYTNDPSALASLFEFLGEDFDLPTVMAVLAERHSY